MVDHACAGVAPLQRSGTPSTDRRAHLHVVRTPGGALSLWHLGLPAKDRPGPTRRQGGRSELERRLHARAGPGPPLGRKRLGGHPPSPARRARVTTGRKQASARVRTAAPVDRRQDQTPSATGRSGSSAPTGVATFCAAARRIKADNAAATAGSRSRATQAVRNPVQRHEGCRLSRRARRLGGSRLPVAARRNRASRCRPTQGLLAHDRHLRTDNRINEIHDQPAGTSRAHPQGPLNATNQRNACPAVSSRHLRDTDGDE